MNLRVENCKMEMLIVMNESSLTTLHIHSSLVSICDYSLGCLLWCQYHIQHSTSVLSKKAPEEVVTDGHEGAIIMCSVVRDDSIHYSKKKMKIKVTTDI